MLAFVGYCIGTVGSRHWLLDLFVHFRVQYACVLFVSAIAASMLRDLRWAAAIWIAAVWVAWPLAPRSESLAAAASDRMIEAPVFKVATLNAWFRNPDTRRVAEYVMRSGADVVFVQEFDRTRMRELAALLPAHFATAFAPDMDRRGAAVVSRWPIESSQSLPLAGTSRYSHWARVRWRDTSVQVIGVHLPWPLTQQLSHERNAQMQALAAWMRETAGPLVVGGDFNLSPWSAQFANALSEAGARDALSLRPTLYTWPTSFLLLGIQIDHCLISQHWQVVSTARGPNVGSDHFPVEVELRLNASATPRAPAAG